MTNRGQTYNTQRANAPARINYLLGERNGTNYPQPLKLPNRRKIVALRRIAIKRWAANDKHLKRGLLTDAEHERIEQRITDELNTAIAPLHEASIQQTFGVEVQS